MFDAKIPHEILSLASATPVMIYAHDGKPTQDVNATPAFLLVSGDPNNPPALVAESGIPVLVVGDRQHDDFDNVRGFLPVTYPLTAPYIGRPFIHGIFDCYTLVHDWMRRERGVILPTNVDRQHGWWNGGYSPYRAWFKTFGAIEVPAADTVGDVVLFTFGKLAAVHSGIYLGDGKVLHHMSGQLSCEVELVSLARHIHSVLRVPEC